MKGISSRGFKGQMIILYLVVVTSILTINAYYGKQLFAQDANIMFGEGLEAYKSKNYSKAAEVFKECLSLVSKNPQQSSMVNFWLAKAVYFDSPFEYEQALGYVSSAIFTKPDFLDSYYFRMLLYKRYFGKDLQDRDLEQIFKLTNP